MYDGGLMTGYLDSLDMQSYIDVCGPVGPLIYNGKGMFTITYPLNEEVFIKNNLIIKYFYKFLKN